MRRPASSGFAKDQLVADTRRDARSWISKTLARSNSSSERSKSRRSVASPASRSPAATWLLRGLRRPLPLPWAKITSAVAFEGTPSKPSSLSGEIRTGLTSPDRLSMKPILHHPVRAHPFRPHDANLFRQRLTHCRKLAHVKVAFENSEHRAYRIDRTDELGAAEAVGHALQKLRKRAFFQRVLARPPLFEIGAAHQKRQLRREVSRDARREPGARGVHHSAKHVPGRMPIGAQILDDLVEPDMRGLQSLVEHFQAVGAHARASEACPPRWLIEKATPPLGAGSAGRDRARSHRAEALLAARDAGTIRPGPPHPVSLRRAALLRRAGCRQTHAIVLPPL